MLTAVMLTAVMLTAGVLTAGARAGRPSHEAGGWNSMPLFQTKPRATPAQMLSAKPVRLSDAEPIEHGAGQWRLTVPLKPVGWAARVLRVPQNVTKTFELDALGKLVWDACDGTTSVRQVIEKLAGRYDLNEREAEVATLAFLRTLMRKGLIGIRAKDVT
jgi:hypothetical protein